MNTDQDKDILAQEICEKFIKEICSLHGFEIGTELNEENQSMP